MIDQIRCRPVSHLLIAAVVLLAGHAQAVDYLQCEAAARAYTAQENIVMPAIESAQERASELTRKQLQANRRYCDKLHEYRGTNDIKEVDKRRDACWLNLLKKTSSYVDFYQKERSKHNTDIAKLEAIIRDMKKMGCPQQ